MVKKKNGQTEHQRQKLENIQRLKTYSRRMIDLLHRLGFNDIASLITKQNMEYMFLMRTMPVKIDMTNAPLFDKGEKKEIQCLIYDTCRESIVKLTEDENDGDDRIISITDFFELLLPVFALLFSENPALKISFDNTPDINRLKEWFYGEERTNTCLLQSLYNRVEEAVSIVLGSLIFKVANPVGYYLFFDEIQMPEYSPGGRSVRVVTMRTQEAEVCKLIVDNQTRRAFRVNYIISSAVCRAEVEVPYHPKLNPCPQKKYELFILDHAITRMFQRIDGIHPSVVNYYMNISFAAWNAGWYKDSLHISYDIRKKKLGYFVAQIIGNKILIRTFLFITYNKTFEGELLNLHTGLEKLDKKYLNIDKLSTFLASKIGRYSPMGKIFSDANCEHLLDLESIRDIVDDDVQGNAITGEFLMKYLRKAADDGAL